VKSFLITALLAAAAAAGSTLASAQDGPPAGRAGVLAQTEQLAQAGYRGTRDDTTYPSDVEAAQRRIDPRWTRPGTFADTSGYGAQTGTHSESGARQPRSPQALYFGA
jgi:hypothetical protein